MAYQMVANAVTLNDFEGHSPVADVFKCNPSNICAAFYTISTDIVLAWFLWISRASCQQLSQKTAIIFQLTQRVAGFLCSSRASCFTLALGIALLISFIYNRNNKGPRTEAWGTPVETNAVSEQNPPSAVNCCLSVRTFKPLLNYTPDAIVTQII